MNRFGSFRFFPAVIVQGAFECFIEAVIINRKYECKYLLVGGWAVGIYGHPRATKDIDFLVSSDKNNLKKLQKAFLEFGSPPVDIEAFNKEEYVIRIGSSPTQIDIINKASGININDCYKRKNVINIDGLGNSGGCHQSVTT